MGNAIATLQRYSYSPTATMGRLSINGLILFSIECPWLKNAVNVSCIPEGFYLCQRVVSPKYGDCFAVSVPGRTHILFHVANWAKNVKGCIGLGLSAHSNELKVNSSGIAVNSFMDELEGVESFFLHVTQYKPRF